MVVLMALVRLMPPDVFHVPEEAARGWARRPVECLC
jgi:hypothetical protein